MKKIVLILLTLSLLSCGPEPKRKHYYQIRLVENNALMGWESMWRDDDILFKVGDTVLHHGMHPSIKGAVKSYPAVIIKVYR